MRIEADRFVVRWVGAADQGWSGIAWSGLGDADAVGGTLPGWRGQGIYRALIA